MLMAMCLVYAIVDLLNMLDLDAASEDLASGESRAYWWLPVALEEAGSSERCSKEVSWTRRGSGFVRFIRTQS